MYIHAHPYINENCKKDWSTGGVNGDTITVASSDRRDKRSRHASAEDLQRDKGRTEDQRGKAKKKLQKRGGWMVKDTMLAELVLADKFVESMALADAPVKQKAARIAQEDTDTE